MHPAIAQTFEDVIPRTASSLLQIQSLKRQSLAKKENDHVT